MARGLDGRPRGLDGAFHQQAQLNRFPLQLDEAAVDAREVEQVVDEPGHRADLAVDDVLRPQPQTPTLLGTPGMDQSLRMVKRSPSASTSA